MTDKTFTLKKGKDDYHLTIAENTILVQTMAFNFPAEEPLQIEVKGFISANINISEEDANLFHANTGNFIKTLKASLNVECDSYKHNKNVTDTNKGGAFISRQIPMWDMAKIDFEGKDDYLIKGIRGEYDMMYPSQWGLRIDVIPLKELAKEHKFEVINCGTVIAICGVCGKKYNTGMTCKSVMCKHLQEYYKTKENKNES